MYRRQMVDTLDSPESDIAFHNSPAHWFWGPAILARKLLVAMGVSWATLVAFCRDVGQRPVTGDVEVNMRTLTANVTAWCNSIKDADYGVLAKCSTNAMDKQPPEKLAGLLMICASAASTSTGNTRKVVDAVNALLMPSIGVCLGEAVPRGKSPNKRQVRPLDMSQYLTARDNYRCRAFAGLTRDETNGYFDKYRIED